MGRAFQSGIVCLLIGLSMVYLNIRGKANVFFATSPDGMLLTQGGDWCHGYPCCYLARSLIHSDAYHVSSSWPLYDSSTFVWFPGNLAINITFASLILTVSAFGIWKNGLRIRYTLQQLFVLVSAVSSWFVLVWKFSKPLWDALLSLDAIALYITLFGLFVFWREIITAIEGIANRWESGRE